ncbi:hypothetical protein [Nitratireductor thuwali]|uniref:hypothetical protein n=1 Tax=Nitratireductor thuwali TaxID=2267699 RepID=UPI0030CDFE03
MKRDNPQLLAVAYSTNQYAVVGFPWVKGGFERFLSTGLPALAAFIGLISIYLQHMSIELQKEGLELQKQSLDLQRQDSSASGDFYRDALRLLDDQKNPVHHRTRVVFTIRVTAQLRQSPARNR